MTNKITTVLFDLDGTILDTNELIIRSFQHCLKGIVADDFGPEHIIPSMGQPLVSQLRLFSGQDDVTKLVDGYRAFNLKLHDELVRPFPGVREVMEQLDQAGFDLGVVTTKMRLTTDRGLKLTGLDQYVKTIVTIDDVTHAKPHPEPVVKAMRQLGALPEQTLMVGDSVVDIESAAAAGAIPVGVSWSLKGEQLLRESGARHILHDMRDLFDIVRIGAKHA
ncbi:pyrophosphatase PpaX [Paenibacillaceae bacterium]|nr:pyrophosphatase PpaX [Paenibacillaceae bacterium]